MERTKELKKRVLKKGLAYMPASLTTFHKYTPETMVLEIVLQMSLPFHLHLPLILGRLEVAPLLVLEFYN